MKAYSFDFCLVLHEEESSSMVRMKDEFLIFGNSAAQGYVRLDISLPAVVSPVSTQRQNTIHYQSSTCGSVFILC